ncbi:MAG: imidazole glycerol phosphate synthase subunit HisH [Rhodospirillales bacterium]|jgi:glutamine amidotransferase|nr:imidazole glycerol phosphate synthase subunit HisH [Rhodospirillales bacterium]
MNVAIVDYGSGNLRSAQKAFERANAEADLGFAVTVTADAEEVRRASHVVLPGVGAFADCMRGLESVSGMRDALEDTVVCGRKPFLGICVGMQLMARVGREHGDHAGLGWLDGEVVALSPGDATLKVPHMGWNELVLSLAHPVFEGVAEGAHVYFVHSYGFVCTEPANVIANVDYGGEVTAAIGRDNLVGTQFHPEKSQATGLAIIANFLRWRP